MDNVFKAIAAGGIALIVVYIAIVVLMIASYWKIFTKAGQPGWAVLIPFYNSYVLIVEVCKMPVVWFVLSLIPCVGLIVIFVVPFKLAEKFGKDAGFAVGMLLLSFVFVPILAFGSAEYEGGRKSRRSRDYDDDEDEDEDEDEDDRPRRKSRRDDDD